MASNNPVRAIGAGDGDNVVPGDAGNSGNQATIARSTHQVTRFEGGDGPTLPSYAQVARDGGMASSITRVPAPEKGRGSGPGVMQAARGGRGGGSGRGGRGGYGHPAVIPSTPPASVDDRTETISAETDQNAGSAVVNITNHAPPFYTGTWFHKTTQQRKDWARIASDENLKLLHKFERVSDARDKGELLDVRAFPAVDTPQPTTAEDAARINTMVEWITLLNCDALLAAKMFEREQNQYGGNVCVLHIASPVRGYTKFLAGSDAQEASLFARTTLEHSLRKDLLPTNVIYSPDVLVWSMDGNQKLDVDNHFYVDVISCAAIDDPGLKQIDMDGKKVWTWKSVEEERMMERKIRGILRVAMAKQVKYLVLGPFGCEVDKRSAECIARLFKRCLLRSAENEDFYGQGLRAVSFAVLDHTDQSMVWAGFETAFEEDDNGLDQIDIDDGSALIRFTKKYACGSSNVAPSA